MDDLEGQAALLAAQAALRLRPYQHEMLDQAMNGNVIVAMETGSGKTLIAIARMQAELERCDSSKLIWFLTPSVALAAQQKAVIQQHLSAYTVLSLTGDDGVDAWSDQRLWDAVLDKVRVVVGTPAVLLDALSHGFIKVSRLALLVFDEAHRCVKGSPSNRIMRDFYDPARRACRAIPHVLGLSASPVINVKHGSLATIEQNLDATVVTPKQQRSTLEQFIHPPEVQVVRYTPMIPTVDERTTLCAALQSTIDRYDYSADPWIVELKNQDDDWAHRQLQKFEKTRKTYCTEQLITLSRRAVSILEQLGPLSAESYLATCVASYLEAVGSQPLAVADVSVREREHLADVLRSVASQRSPIPRDSSLAIENTTDKARKLLDCLKRLASPGNRGILFVEQRAMVTAVATLLQESPEIAGQYRVATFVGTSESTAGKTSIAELFDRKRNEESLEDFRAGTRNLMIATSVLEEGIDVPTCNMVVCFDTTKTLVQFMQRRGRARQPSSKYVLFVADTDWSADPSRWQMLESEMKDAYMNEDRE